MVVFFFCVLSFTRTAIAILSSRLFGAVDRRLQQPRDKDSRNTMDDQRSMVRHATSTSGSMDQASTRNSKDSDSTDTSMFYSPRQDEDDHISRHPHKPTILVKSPVMKDDTHYNMNHKRRGRCVILNHRKFEMGPDWNRKGSEVDVLKITSVFQNVLGFDVITHDDLTTEQIMDTAKRLSEEDHKDNDCFCMFILTHGTTSDTLYSKDCPYSLKTVWQKFTGDHCQTLVGKPKLFFVQACRGDSYDSGVGVYNAGYSETDSVAIVSYKIPTHADFLIAHSTVDGFYSWRSTTEGTVYVQQLCEVIEEHWQTHDLAEMMTVTARLVANEYKSVHHLPDKHEQKQMPSTTSTLTRKLLFTKKDKTA
ncbi:caspase-1 isoform X2 [Halictus rubicundus]|uniref:caspase-1 isoform X2 n=1 Tax=Halictus rubicundus TaxID=77578 RepID=UPI00403748F1